MSTNSAISRMPGASVVATTLGGTGVVAGTLVTAAVVATTSVVVTTSVGVDPAVDDGTAGSVVDDDAESIGGVVLVDVATAPSSSESLHAATTIEIRAMHINPRIAQ